MTVDRRMIELYNEYVHTALPRREFIARLKCDYGTSGGFWVYPPPRWDRLRWFFPYVHRTGEFPARIYRLDLDTGERKIWRELKCTLGAIIDEVKRRPTRAHPGLALRMGQHIYGCMKRSLRRPGALALLEHSLAHDVGTDALRGAAKQVVDGTGFSPCAELEVLTEVLLIEDPSHQRTPLRAPVLVLGRVPMLEGHAFRGHVTIEAQSDVDEYVAHDCGR